MKCIKIPSEDFIFIGEKIESMANKYIFKPMGLSLAAMRILSYLENKKITTAKELITLTGKTKSNIAQRLSLLEKNNLIVRKKFPQSKDKRETYLKITALGRKKLKEASGKIEKFHLAKEKFFTQKEIQEHIKFMQKLSIFLDKEDAKLRNIFNKLN